ncbi:unnamed protein product, partial [Laminaria digitata]
MRSPSRSQRSPPASLRSNATKRKIADSLDWSVAGPESKQETRLCRRIERLRQIHDRRGRTEGGGGEGRGGGGRGRRDANTWYMKAGKMVDRGTEGAMKMTDGGASREARNGLTEKEWADPETPDHIARKKKRLEDDAKGANTWYMKAGKMVDRGTEGAMKMTDGG